MYAFPAETMIDTKLDIVVKKDFWLNACAYQLQ